MKPLGLVKNKIFFSNYQPLSRRMNYKQDFQENCVANVEFEKFSEQNRVKKVEFTIVFAHEKHNEN